MPKRASNTLVMDLLLASVTVVGKKPSVPKLVVTVRVPSARAVVLDRFGLPKPSKLVVTRRSVPG